MMSYQEAGYDLILIYVVVGNNKPTFCDLIESHFWSPSDCWVSLIELSYLCFHSKNLLRVGILFHTTYLVKKIL